jgi:hypothetical protein
MGKRPAEVELFVGNMVSMRREDAASMQREEPFAMATERGHIAAKLRLRCKSTSDECSAGNLHVAISGSRGRVTSPATRWCRAIGIPTATKLETVETAKGSLQPAGTSSTRKSMETMVILLRRCRKPSLSSSP